MAHTNSNGGHMYAHEGLSARSGLPDCLSPPPPAKKTIPPKGGVFEDKHGGYRGCGDLVPNDTRA
eukprot:7384914-Pyramimonas_sp.AAC.1